MAPPSKNKPMQCMTIGKRSCATTRPSKNEAMQQYNEIGCDENPFVQQLLFWVLSNWALPSLIQISVQHIISFNLIAASTSPSSLFTRRCRCSPSQSLLTIIILFLYFFKDYLYVYIVFVLTTMLLQ